MSNKILIPLFLVSVYFVILPINALQSQQSAIKAFAISTTPSAIGFYRAHDLKPTTLVVFIWHHHLLRLVLQTLPLFLTCKPALHHFLRLSVHLVFKLLTLRPGTEPELKVRGCGFTVSCMQ